MNNYIETHSLNSLAKATGLPHKFVRRYLKNMISEKVGGKEGTQWKINISPTMKKWLQDKFKDSELWDGRLLPEVY